MNAVHTLTQSTLRTFGNESTNTRNDDTLDRVFGPLLSGFLCPKDLAVIDRLTRPIRSPIVRLVAFIAWCGREFVRPFVEARANWRADRQERIALAAHRAAMTAPRTYLPWTPKACEEAKQSKPAPTVRPTKTTKKPRTAKKTARPITKKPRSTVKKATPKTRTATKKVKVLYPDWSYRELQSLAKEWGLAANGTREELSKRIQVEDKRQIKEAKEQASKPDWRVVVA